jgi:hypothetical protein
LNLAYNRLDLVKCTFTSQIATQFSEDPIAIFHSMPLPQQKILARMAIDGAARGQTAFNVKTAQKMSRVKLASSRKDLPLQLCK